MNEDIKEIIKRIREDPEAMKQVEELLKGEKEDE